MKMMEARRREHVCDQCASGSGRSWALRVTAEPAETTALATAATRHASALFILMAPLLSAFPLPHVDALRPRSPESSGYCASFGLSPQWAAPTAGAPLATAQILQAVL
jgi:hypothetical protein